MIHPTPPTVLLTTTRQPFVVQLSGSLARGAKLIDPCLPPEPSPQQMATFARELSTLLRPRFRTTHVSLSNFWVPIQSLCKGGDYATLVPP